jgi:hypothetical protein
VTDIVPGKTTFRYTHGDSNALWVVQTRRGNGVWQCVISEDDADYAGDTRVFTTEEISNAVSVVDFWESLKNETVDFWKNRTAGEVFHYANSSNQFVRSEVVVDPGKGYVLRPLALVGKWRTNELPRWWDSGHFTDGAYWVQKVRKGETFQPNESALWEVQKTRRSDDGLDPTSLPPVDISIPAPTSVQREAADMLAVIAEVQALLEIPRESSDFAETYRCRLAEVAALIADKVDLGQTPPVTSGPRLA